jgi:adenine-specific DNA-methyltransferase
MKFNYKIQQYQTDAVEAVVKMKPYYFVMRDSSMAVDFVAANFNQIFEAYSKDTVRKVL